MNLVELSGEFLNYDEAVRQLIQSQRPGIGFAFVGLGLHEEALPGDIVRRTADGRVRFDDGLIFGFTLEAYEGDSICLSDWYGVGFENDRDRTNA